MKVDVFTLCWNEMDVLPWVVDYWKQYANHVTVYDNGSTDGSAEYLGSFDWVTVIPFESGGFNDTVNKQIKNSCWQGSDADFVVVCDMDECLLAENIRRSLKRMKDQGATVCAPRWYELMAVERPAYERGKFLHEVSPMCCPNAGGKMVVFDPNEIFQVNYSAGAHECNPRGNVKWYDGEDLFVLHINHNLSLEYKLGRYKELEARLSNENRRRGHGVHYAFSEKVLKDAWDEDMKRVVNLNDVING